MEQEATKEQKRFQQLREQLIKKLVPFEHEITVESHPKDQLANIVGLTFKRVQGQHIMLECNRYGIAISTGSACQVGQQHQYRMMLATWKTTEEANRFARLSLEIISTVLELNIYIDTHL